VLALIAQAQAKTVDPVTVALITACGALFGVLVGGVLNGLMSRWVESRRIKRDARIGARLVRLDLSEAAFHMKNAEGSCEWTWLHDPSPAAWERYSDALADRLADDAWQDVTASISQLFRLSDVMRVYPTHGSGSLTIKLEADTIEVLAAMRRDVTKAYNRLAPLAGGTTVNLLHEVNSRTLLDVLSEQAPPPN
jgi:hypothetical protein